MLSFANYTALPLDDIIRLLKILFKKYANKQAYNDYFLRLIESSFTAN